MAGRTRKMLEILLHPTISISSGCLLRNLHRNGPVCVGVVLAACRLKVQLLQAFRDGADLSVSDGSVVDLDDRCDLEPRPRKEYLVGAVKLRPVYVPLDNRHTELLLRKFHDRVTRDPLQNICRDRRCDKRTLAQEEDVG